MEKKYVDLTWHIIDDFSSCLVFKDGDPLKVEDRVAFITKTPRVWDGRKWITGPKGDGGNIENGKDIYGFYQPSRDWCEQEIRKLYNVYPKEWSMDAILWGSGIEDIRSNEEQEVYDLISRYKHYFEITMHNINIMHLYKRMYLTSLAVRMATVERDDEYKIVCDGETESMAQLTQSILMEAFPSIRYYSVDEFANVEWYKRIKKNISRFPNYSKRSLSDTIICPDLFMHDSEYAWEAYEILMAYCNSVSTVAYTREEADLL